MIEGKRDFHKEHRLSVIADLKLAESILARHVGPVHTILQEIRRIKKHLEDAQ